MWRRWKILRGRISKSHLHLEFYNAHPVLSNYYYVLLNCYALRRRRTLYCTKKKPTVFKFSNWHSTIVLRKARYYGQTVPRTELISRFGWKQLLLFWTRRKTRTLCYSGSTLLCFKYIFHQRISFLVMWPFAINSRRWRRAVSTVRCGLYQKKQTNV